MTSHGSFNFKTENANHSHLTMLSLNIISASILQLTNLKASTQE